jgi:lysophospholipase L1-like esterase
MVCHPLFMRNAWLSLLITVALNVNGSVAAENPASRRPADETKRVWREAFGSSPATTDDARFDAVVKASHMPADLIERMRPKHVAGTLRQRLVLSAGGTQIRLRISNETGLTPLAIAAVSAGLAGQLFDAKPGSLRAVTFGGSRAVTIPPGAPVLSDPIALKVDRGAAIVVSVHPERELVVAPSGEALNIAQGDQTMMERLGNASDAVARPLVTAVAVLAPRSVHTIVALGDSITDGNRGKLMVLHSWPEELARRLAAHRSGSTYSVVNAGIGGNRLLRDGVVPEYGAAALARLDRDVLRIDGVTHLLVLEGTNDIGRSGGDPVFGDSPAIDENDLIFGYRQIIARAHANHVKVVLATIPPFGGSTSYSSPAKEHLRQGINRWIRTSHDPDGIVDFDQVLRDPASPSMLRARFDSGDHLHPNEEGSRAMGDAVNLALF